MPGPNTGRNSLSECDRNTNRKLINSYRLLENILMKERKLVVNNQIVVFMRKYSF